MTKANCIRVLNVDDHPLLREAGDRRDAVHRGEDVQGPCEAYYGHNRCQRSSAGRNDRGPARHYPIEADNSSSRVPTHLFSFGITAAIRRCDTAAANNRGERLLLKIRISRIRRDSK